MCCLFKQNFPIKVLLLASFITNTQVVLAKNVAVIEELIVQAAKSQNIAFNLPYTTNIIDSKQLLKSTPRSLPEALAEVPGVMVQKTANGHGSPFIRGFTGYRTLTSIDGVRYNNSVYRDGPNEYFSLIDPYSLNSIELLSGPSSSLYGSDAIGGTLNLETGSALRYDLAQGKQYIEGSQQLRFGSAENSQISRTGIKVGKAEEWGLRAGLSLKDFGDVEAADIGVQENTGYDEQGFDVRFDRQINKNWELNTLYQSLSQNDVWRTHSTIYAKSFAGTQVGDDLVRLKDQGRHFAYAKLKGKALHQYIDELEVTISHQRWGEEGYRVLNNGDYLEDYFDSSMTGVDLQLTHWGETTHWVYGADYYQDTIDSGRKDYNADTSLHRVRIQGPVGDDARYDLLGLYLQAEVELSDQLRVNLGSRYTNARAGIGKFEDPATGLPASFEGSWENIVSSARLIYSFESNWDWRLWGGLSQSFRAPNIADLSRYGKSRSNELEIAATDLKAETFLTYELGLKIQGGGARFNASFYYTDINDYITSVPTGSIINNQVEVSKKNSSDGYIQGLELEAFKQLNENWQVFANTTWLEGHLNVYQTQNSFQREAYGRIMPLTSTLGLNWQNKTNAYWLRFSVSRAEKADKLSSADSLDQQRIPLNGTPAYTLVNIGAGWNINKTLSITLSAENLLDESYRSHGSGTNEPGRGLILAMNVSF